MVSSGDLSLPGATARTLFSRRSNGSWCTPVTRSRCCFAVRGTAVKGASLQMSWYNDTLGPSQAQTLLPLPVERDWRTLRIDLVVPEHGVAAGLFLRLAPSNLARASIDIDNVAVVVWHAAGTRAACGYVRFDAGAPTGSLAVSTTMLPGAPDADRPSAGWITAEILPVATAAPLPPGPVDGGWGTVE